MNSKKLLQEARDLITDPSRWTDGHARVLAVLDKAIKETP